MRRFLLLCTAALALAPTAQAVTLQPAQQPYTRWADAAKVPTVDGTIALDGTSPFCPRSACSIPGTIWFALPLADHEDRVAARQTLLHELGHQFDYQRMTDRLRDRFRELTHDPRPWAAPPNSPHERFAEAYSLCAWQPRRVQWFDMDIGYGYHPTRRAHRAICRMIRSA